MSYENVKEYFDRQGLGSRLTVQEHVSDTVQHAAEAIGCEPERIAKTMSFMLKEGPVLIVTAGDARVNSSKFKAVFHQKPVMIPGDEVENTIGHAPGGVCPFAVKDNVNVYLDISLKRFADIHAAAGNPRATVHLTLDELEKHSHMSDWVDVCKNWQSE